MSSIEKAVILAAGRGSRMASISRGKPKPFLSIDGVAHGETFLDFHLKALASRGVDEIFIVGNRAMFGAHLQATPRLGARVTWVLNPTEDLSTSGSAHSVHVAFEADHGILDKRSRVVVLDADIVYDWSALDLLLARGEGRSKVLVHDSLRRGHDGVHVFSPKATPALPRFIGRGLLGNLVIGDSVCVGEACGIMVLEPDDHMLVRAATSWLMHHSTAGMLSEHDEILQRMMMLGRVEAVVLAHDRNFFGVDTPDEYERLVGEVQARLVRLSSRGQGTCATRQVWPKHSCHRAHGEAPGMPFRGR